MDNQNVQAFKDLIQNLKPSEDVVIFLSETATRDVMAGALSLSLALQAEPFKKTVKVAYPKPTTVAWSHLVGIQKVIQQVGNKNFIISLDYIEGSIEKVSYNIEGNKFNLVIEPKAGSQMFSEKNVHYSYSGMNAGVIITMGASMLESLGVYYQDNKDLFNQRPIVVIDNNQVNAKYGRVNVVKQTSSISELVAQLLKLSDLPINTDIASNLYDGLLAGSRNFSAPFVSAETFEMAAHLMRSGAKKHTPAFMRNEEMPKGEFAGGGEEEKQLPPDWLKPKIFKGGSNLI